MAQHPWRRRVAAVRSAGFPGSRAAACRSGSAQPLVCPRSRSSCSRSGPRSLPTGRRWPDLPGRSDPDQLAQVQRLRAAAPDRGREIPSWHDACPSRRGSKRVTAGKGVAAAPLPTPRIAPEPLDRRARIAQIHHAAGIEGCGGRAPARTQMPEQTGYELPPAPAQPPGSPPHQRV